MFYNIMKILEERKELIYDGKTPLEKIFHNATSRIIDFLITNQEYDYSIAQISEITQIPIRTVHRLIPNLISNNLVKNRKVGNITMYKINTDNRLIGLLYNFVIESIKLDAQNNL